MSTLNTSRVAMGAAAALLAGIGIYFAPSQPEPAAAPSQISGSGQTFPADIHLEITQVLLEGQHLNDLCYAEVYQSQTVRGLVEHSGTSIELSHVAGQPTTAVISNASLEGAGGDVLFDLSRPIHILFSWKPNPGNGGFERGSVHLDPLEAFVTEWSGLAVGQGPSGAITHFQIDIPRINLRPLEELFAVQAQDDGAGIGALAYISNGNALGLDHDSSLWNTYEGFPLGITTSVYGFSDSQSWRVFVRHQSDSVTDIATVDRGSSATLNTISEAEVLLDSSGWSGTDTLYLVLTPQSEHPALPPPGATSSAWNTLRITNFRKNGTTKLQSGNTVVQTVPPGDYVLEVWQRSEVTAGSTSPHALIPLTLVQGSNPAVTIVN